MFIKCSCGTKNGLTLGNTNIEVHVHIVQSTKRQNSWLYCVPSSIYLLQTSKQKITKQPKTTFFFFSVRSVLLQQSEKKEKEKVLFLICCLLSSSLKLVFRSKVFSAFLIYSKKSCWVFGFWRQNKKKRKIKRNISWIVNCAFWSQSGNTVGAAIWDHG